MSIVVPGWGLTPNDVMLVGEAPGEDEARQGQPFVGRAGHEQDVYFSLARLHRRRMYMTNVVKDYIEGNPDPTPELIAKWTPELESEIRRVRPRYVIAVGRFAARWFLGDVDMEAVHGTPQRSSRVSDDCRIIPVYHPAYGFYDTEARALIWSDYTAAGRIIRGEISREPVEDAYPNAEYTDCEGVGQLLGYLTLCDDEISFDTEGVPGSEWSFQICGLSGTGLVIRRSQPWFAEAIAEIKRHLDYHRPVVVLHNGMYDLEMMRLMGLDLTAYELFDTMMAAYLLRLEPQSLKHQARRHCGMVMREYAEVVGKAGEDKQVAYLTEILSRSWPKPEARIKSKNDGTAKAYTPQPIERRAEAILTDFATKGADLWARWRKVDPLLRRSVEAVLGPMPIGTLADVPLAEAVYYAGRDADATLRMYHVYKRKLKEMKLESLMGMKMAVMPVFEEMQANGFPAKRAHFETLRERMDAEMEALQSRISHRFFGGRPFNPASPPQTRALLMRRGLRGVKKSKKTGLMSTGKKSIEHLRYEDEAVEALIDWREHQKVRDAFCNPVIERFDDRFPDLSVAPIRCDLKITRVSSGRPAASDPNLLAIPVRNDLGSAVRDGFEALEGYELGTWDLSQIEMRVMADKSRDKNLCQLLIDGRDIHTETTLKLFDLKEAPDEKSSEWAAWDHKYRYPTKRAGFGIITGISATGLLDQLRMFGCTGWDEDSCENLITEWLRIYPGVFDYMHACRNFVRQHGYIRDSFGMYRYLPGIWSDDKKTAAEAERQSHSHDIQATAQGMIQTAMVWLRPQIQELRNDGFDIRWLLEIHDEVIFMFQEGLWDLLNPLVQEALTKHTGIRLRVPVKAKGNHAMSWGQLK